MGDKRNGSLRWLPAPLLACALGACTSIDSGVHIATPTTIAPPPVPSAEPQVRTTGAIYSEVSWRPLFEDRRARHPGDILSIEITEKTSASQSTNSQIDRSAKIDGGIVALPFTGASALARANFEGNSSNSFQGKGNNESDNVFKGNITVTVIDVLSNGNLRVSGEKQIGLNGSVDILRFSGVISPRTIRPDNSVVSTQVADARLEFTGRGPVHESRVMGWLSRFFLSFLPI
ncbi:MAG: flagellar basal body L-ring protein FlgH [Burkholderiaceae bacterium]